MIKKGSLKQLNTAKVFDCVFLLLLFQFFVFPKIYMSIKAITLFALLFLWITQRKAYYHINNKVVVLSAYILYNIFSTILGVINGYEKEAIRMATINVIWPFCFLIFIHCVCSKERSKKLNRAIFFFAFLLCIIDSLIMISQFFHISSIMMLLNILHIGGSAGKTSLIFFRSDHIYFYAFLAPYMLSYLTNKKAEKYKNGTNQTFEKVTAIYVIMLAILSGMGGIWLALFVSGGICCFRYAFWKRKTVVVSLLICLILIMGGGAISYSKRGMAYHVVEEINNHLGGNENDQGWIIRTNQKKAMIEKWLDYPIFGSGTGSTIIFDKAGVIVEQSQSELSYYVMLYQKGICGVALFFAVVVCSIRSLIKRRDIIWLSEPFLIGMVCFLVSHAVNPYLSNMSTMWILFLPMIIGNSETSNSVIM